jgi:hypothetical protein
MVDPVKARRLQSEKLRAAWMFPIDLPMASRKPAKLKSFLAGAGVKVTTGPAPFYTVDDGNMWLYVPIWFNAWLLFDVSIADVITMASYNENLLDATKCLELRDNLLSVVQSSEEQVLLIIEAAFSSDKPEYKKWVEAYGDNRTTGSSLSQSATT